VRIAYRDSGDAPGEFLIRKLERFTRLSPADKQAVRGMAGERLQRLSAREDLISERERPTSVRLIMSGWAARYKLIGDGRRQILAFLVPGDTCDLNIYMLREMDHSIGALTAVTFADVSRETMDRVLAEYPRLAQALLWEQLVTAAIQREWTFNIGRLSAFERVGHLMCEIFLRLRSVGLTEADSCELPLTQPDLADATGLSAVHVNRTLQELRAQNLITLRGKELTIPDLQALQTASQFDPNYLHLDRDGREFDANEAE
jgi:CRP-like cAMP-binding protein